MTFLKALTRPPVNNIAAFQRALLVRGGPAIFARWSMSRTKALTLLTPAAPAARAWVGVGEPQAHVLPSARRHAQERRALRSRWLLVGRHCLRLRRHAARPKQEAAVSRSRLDRSLAWNKPSDADPHIVYTSPERASERTNERAKPSYNTESCNRHTLRWTIRYRWRVFARDTAAFDACRR